MQIQWTARDVGRLVDTNAAAAILGRRPCTLRQWRCREIGPSYVLYPSAAGKRPRILYPLADLQAFAVAERRRMNRMPRPAGGRPPGAKNKPKRPLKVE